MKTKIANYLIALLIVLSIGNGACAEEEEVHLVISKSNHTLEVILNNTPVYHFKIATGITSKKTPEGTFRIIRKVKNPWYIPKNIRGGDPENPLGSRWIGLDVPHTDGYKYGIHGTNEPDSIGKSISQGCVRMRNSDVEWLFRHIPLGSKVIIKP